VQWLFKAIATLVSANPLHAAQSFHLLSAAFALHPNWTLRLPDINKPGSKRCSLTHFCRPTHKSAFEFSCICASACLAAIFVLAGLGLFVTALSLANLFETLLGLFVCNPKFFALLVTVPLLSLELLPALVTPAMLGVVLIGRNCKRLAAYAARLFNLRRNSPLLPSQASLQLVALRTSTAVLPRRRHPIASAFLAGHRHTSCATFSLRALSNFLPLLLPRLPAVAPDAQRPEVLHHVLAALCLRCDVVNVGFPLICTHAATVLAGPCVSDQHGLADLEPGRRAVAPCCCIRPGGIVSLGA
jgi:hypothetical protein